MAGRGRQRGAGRAQECDRMAEANARGAVGPAADPTNDRGFAKANDAETSYSLTFLDGSEIHLPLFGTEAISREHASAEAVVDAVRRSLGKGL